MPKVKVIETNKKARLKLQEGVNIVADIIKETLGPKGRNVIVKKLGPLAPRSMNDGYYIADYIEHKDPIINAGIDMVKEICKKTNDVAGDGTTSTAILAQSLIEEGLKDVEKGKNPIDIKKLIEEDLIYLVDELKKQSKEIKDSKDICDIATISGNNDKEVGEAIKEIYDKVGKNAAITVEKSSESKIRIETVKGIYFQNGFEEAKGFVNNIRNTTAEYKNVKVLCVDEKLEYLDDIEQFLTRLLNVYRGWDTRLLIIAQEIPYQMDVAHILCDNLKAALLKQKTPNGEETGFFNIPVQAPDFGPVRQEMLEDIAIATGGTCVSKMNGLKLKDIEVEQIPDILGNADKCIVNTNSTVILGGKANKERLDERISILKGEIKQLPVNAKVTREKLEKRLQIISSGVGIIHAGGATEMESKERHLRLEDAILAVKSALAEGVSIGGGYTYLQLSKIAKTKYLKNACKAIAEQVASNAGKNPDEIINNSLNRNLGYNALTDKYENLDKTGVIDSTKVIRVALQNAVSLTSLFLTTSSAVIETVEDEE